MPESRLEYLFDCYVHEKCSAEEEKEFMESLTNSENEQSVKELLGKFIENTGSDLEMPKQIANSILQNILQKDKTKVVTLNSKKVNFKLLLHMAAAAVVILFISGVFYWIFVKENRDKMTASVIPSEKKSSISPGGNHAILKLANGSTIVLDSIQNGKIHYGNVAIIKQNGLLVYDGSLPSKTGAPVTYNTLTTPRGGQYQIVLPDGSKVWLNASSSLHFPTAFVGHLREVELTGEAYFEVAKNKEKPFHVKSNGMQVEVLGTHFDVKAYQDDDYIKTTLLEGSVKIKRGSVSGLLKPGQQGILEMNDNNVIVKNADINEVMAWKNGLFEFDGADIKTIMREISRWYDVDIVYSGKVPVRSFEGKISRDAQLSEVLKILELSNVKLRVEGKKIIVD